MTISGREPAIRVGLFFRPPRPAAQAEKEERECPAKVPPDGHIG